MDSKELHFKHILPMKKEDPQFLSALVIREPWIDMIFMEKDPKDWEIRGCWTSKRGRILLAKSGTNTIVGETEIIDCIELDTVDFIFNENHHKIPKEKHKNKLPYPHTYAWVFKHSIRYEKPVDYDHPRGAVIWVNIPINDFKKERVYV